MKRFGILLAVAVFWLLAPSASADAPACDYNGDGACDNADEAILMGAFGSEWGDDDFIPAADHDQDGIISLVDAALFMDLRLLQ